MAAPCNAGEGDRTHTILRSLDFESSDLSQACHWQPGIRFPLTLRRVLQDSRASRAICRPERIESGLSSLPASGLQCSGRHPPLVGLGGRMEAVPNLTTRCENFCSKNPPGRLAERFPNRRGRHRQHATTRTLPAPKESSGRSPREMRKMPAVSWPPKLRTKSLWRSLMSCSWTLLVTRRG